MTQRKINETIEKDDILIFSNGESKKVKTFIGPDVILDDEMFYSKFKLYIGVDAGHIKIKKHEEIEGES